MKLRTSHRSRSVVLELGQKDEGLPPVAVPELQVNRVLVPVDFSECSHKAFQYATHFARQFNAEMMLLHVIIAIPPAPEMLFMEAEGLSGQYHEDIAKELSQWRNEIALKVSVKAVTRTGMAAYQEIIEAARESNTDLIIIGHRGQSSLTRMFIGSTAEKVVRHAPCPVLVIRDQEHDFVRE